MITHLLIFNLLLQILNGCSENIDVCTSKNLQKQSKRGRTDIGYITTITALYPNLTHYDTNIKTGNAFFYKKDEKKYLVTTAHLLFDSPSSTDSLRPCAIKCGYKNITLKNYSYSRFFDVAVFLIDDEIIPFDSNDILNQYQKVFVTYIDTNSNKFITISTNYNPSVNSTVSMGSINQALIPGSSGSPVMTDNEEVVGMISCQGDEYQNMTLVVPIATINAVIDRSNLLQSQDTNGILGINIDTEKKIYPGVLTVPLNSGYLNLLPDGASITNGELVVQSNNKNLKPFDIITKVDDTLLKGGNRLANIALEKVNKSLELNCSVKKLSKKKWRKKYGVLPRGDFKGDTGEKIFFNPTINNSRNQLEIINTNITTFNCVPGQSIKIEYNDSQIYFSTIKSIDNNTIELLESIPDYVENVSEITLFERHSAYWNRINKDLTKGNKFNESSFISPLDLTKMSNYKALVQKFIFRHWCFLVLSYIKSLDIGHQMFIWSNELDVIINELDLKDQNFLYFVDLLNIITIKNIEFSGIYTMNLINIFIRKYLLIKNFSNKEAQDKLEDIRKEYKKSFPNQINKLDTEIIDRVTKLDLVLNSFGNSTFNADSLSSEHYKIKNSVGKAEPRSMVRDNVSFEIDLCLMELEKIKTGDISFSDDSKDDNYLYYPSFYGLLKSYWDHAHLNLSGILGVTLKGDFEDIPDNASLTLTEMQLEMSVWRRRRLLQEHAKGGSWICTYLFRRKMLTQEEYDTFNRFGAYAFREHPRTMKGYWSYLNDLMEKFSKQASDEDWDHFKPWITKTLGLINNGEMEAAYDSFCQEVYYLTENYNSDYSMFDLHQMDVYYGVFNRFSPTVAAC